MRSRSVWATGICPATLGESANGTHCRGGAKTLAQAGDLAPQAWLTKADGRAARRAEAKARALVVAGGPVVAAQGRRARLLLSGGGVAL